MEELIGGIHTRYEVVGSGPPLLLFAPGGFDATIEKWTSLGVYGKTKMMETLPKHATCILFDRRECGRSGGRIERLTWRHYADHAKALLDRLGYDRAVVMGGCMGVPPVLAFGTAYPETTLGMIAYWPVGGARYRMSSHLRFAEHLSYLDKHGLIGVVEAATIAKTHFGRDSRGGPWSTVIQTNPAFATAFVEQDPERYKALVQLIARTMWDRDTAPGAEPEELMRLDIPALIVPGHDASHATSAARYLEECLPKAEYWDVMPDRQTSDNAPARLVEFLASVAG